MFHLYFCVLFIRTILENEMCLCVLLCLLLQSGSGRITDESSKSDDCLVTQPDDFILGL